MDIRIVLGLVVVALAPWLSSAASPAVGFPEDPHAPIHIDDPSDVLLPEPFASNGIRGGSGVDGDPYRVEQWAISGTTTSPAVQIENVPAHFRLSSLNLSGPDPKTTLISVRTLTSATISDSAAHHGLVQIEGVTRVRFENVHLRQVSILVRGAESVEFERVTMEGGSIAISGGQVSFGHFQGSNLYGLHFEPPPETSVSIDDATITFAPTGASGITCLSCTRFNLTASTISATGSNAYNLMTVMGGAGRGLRIEDTSLRTTGTGVYETAQRSSRLRRVSLTGPGPIEAPSLGFKLDGNVTIEDVHLRGVRTGFELYDTYTVRAARLEASSLAGTALQLINDVRDVRVENSVFQDVGAVMAAPYLPNDGFEKWERPPPSAKSQGRIFGTVEIHNSSFLNAREAAFYLEYSEASIDARSNWWGGPHEPPKGWKYPRAMLVPPETIVAPILSSSPHGLNPAAASAPAGSPILALVALMAILVAIRRRGRWAG